MMVLYHRTARRIAWAIARTGFRDSRGTYMFDQPVPGVWLSEVPLTPCEGARGDTVLQVRLPLSRRVLRRFKVLEVGKPYREWLMPARLLNSRASIRVAKPPRGGWDAA